MIADRPRGSPMSSPDPGEPRAKLNPGPDRMELINFSIVLETDSNPYSLPRPATRPKLRLNRTRPNDAAMSQIEPTRTLRAERLRNFAAEAAFDPERDSGRE
jgi:hypothetical protein